MVTMMAENNTNVFSCCDVELKNNKIEKAITRHELNIANAMEMLSLKLSGSLRARKACTPHPSCRHHK